MFQLLLTQACVPDGNVTKLQFMPDMADGPVAKVLRSYLDPPENSVAMNAIFYPESPEEAEQVLESPYYNQRHLEEKLQDGKKLYGDYCTPCHGKLGKGDGTITDKYPRPPDITNDYYKEKKDGFFYYRIVFGGDLMPSYGHAISNIERWKIVLYIRKLQTLD